MPDFQQFSVTRTTAASMTVPRWTIELKITDSQTGALLRDFTGANALSFPAILGQLTNAQQDEFVFNAVEWLIRKRAGLE